MEEKKNYTAKEVAEMCRAYHLVRGGFDGPVHLDVIKTYEKIVPKKVRDIINKLNGLEVSSLDSALD